MVELEHAIENLYKVFSRYRKPRVIEVCPCGCTREHVIAGLLDVPLTNLSLRDLMLYSADAMTTVGTEVDFKYFLPRMLHLITIEEYGYDVDFLFGKLRYARWHTWPEDERAAVREYLRALWFQTLDQYPLVLRTPSLTYVGDLVSGIGSTGEDLSWYLAQWEESDSPASTWNLAELVLEVANDLKEYGQVKFAFWDKLPQQVEQLSIWLKRPAVLRRLRNADLAAVTESLRPESIPEALLGLEQAISRTQC